MTLDYILDNMNYNMVVDNKIRYFGNIQYVSDHMADGKVTSLDISERQPANLKPFITNFLQARKSNPELTIQEYYNSLA